MIQGQPYPGSLGFGSPYSGYGGSYGFQYNPQVGVVGPQGFGGGYEALGVGQYPFVDPKTYWAIAGVSESSTLFPNAGRALFLNFIMCVLFLFLY